MPSRQCTHRRGIRPTTRRRCCLEQPPPVPLSQHDLTMVEALLALQLIAGPPGPLDRVSAVFGLIGITADGVTTYRFLHDGSGCEESNPFLGPSPSTKRIVISAVLSASAMIGVQKLLAHCGRPWSSRMVGYAV